MELGLTPPAKRKITPDQESPIVVDSCSEASPAVLPYSKNAKIKQKENVQAKLYLGLLDSSLRCQVRLWKTGVKDKAEMRQGPGGFAQARFQGEEGWRDTEMPNLMLDPPAPSKNKPAGTNVNKRPAANKHKKKKAVAEEYDEEAAEPEAAEEEAEEEEHAEEESEEEKEEEPEVKLQSEAPAPAKQYLKMWYKNNNSFGFREKGGRQVGSIIGKNMTKAVMEPIATDVIRRLNDGENPLVVIEWARGKMK